MDVNFSVCLRRKRQQYALYTTAVSAHQVRCYYSKICCAHLCTHIQTFWYYHAGGHAHFPLSKASLLSSRVGRYPTFTCTEMGSTPSINTYLYGIDGVMSTPASSRQLESVRLQTRTKIGKPWKYRNTCEITKAGTGREIGWTID